MHVMSRYVSYVTYLLHPVSPAPVDKNRLVLFTLWNTCTVIGHVLLLYCVCEEQIAKKTITEIRLRPRRCGWFVNIEA